MSRQNMPTIESDALRANLLETAVEKVEIRPSYRVLLDIIDGYRGIYNNLEELLYEISHPYRNWNLILPKLRTFVLKNQGHFRRDVRGPEAFTVFTDIFFQAIEDARKNEFLLSRAVESFLAYLDSLVLSLDLSSLKAYETALAEVFSRLASLDDRLMMHIVQGHHPIKKIASHLLKVGGEGEATSDLRPVAGLLKRILSLNYDYWLSEEDPLPWFYQECGEMCTGWEAGKLFSAISHQEIRAQAETLAAIDTERKEGQREALARLLALPSHLDIVRAYKGVPAQLFSGGKAAPVHEEAEDRFAENRKLIFLFRIMDTPGLFLIHEETLREINRSLVHLIRRQAVEEIEGFLLTTLQLLKANVRKYPHTSLQCIQILGTEVFTRGNSRLVETFLWEAVRFGFQYSNVCGVDEYWQPISNPAHLANIRVWLNLIMQEPKWCSTLFSALIINLKLSGTCIKDTDLFQRDITRLLNHPVEPVYNLVKQFGKLMPVFYNEIGAEGLLRDVSTDLDEIHQRKDILIHFLRKQSHVESTNLIVDFVRAIFAFWRTRDKGHLAPFIPAEILRQVPAEGPFVDDLNVLMGRLFEQEKLGGDEELLEWDEGRLDQFLSTQTDLDPGEVRRFALLVRMYRLVQQKYNLGFQELRHHLEQAAGWGFPEMRALLGELESGNTFQGLTALLSELERLKGIILSEKTFEAQEDIYHKRHIAVDIPSVYGRYREKKFDALGLTFRLENLANIYLEKLPKTINLSIITRATFIRIIKCLRLYLQALRIDGITSRQLETYLSLLSSSLGIKRFSYTQYLDIFRGLTEGVKDVIYAYYTNIHENNLSIIIPQIGRENLIPKYQGLWDENDPTGSTHRLSESFLRDLIAETFGLQHLDNFITRIYQTLESQKDLLDEESLDLLMTYNPDRVISFLHQKNPRANNLILLGNKGFNLTMLAAAGKSVPPGFIVTTEVFRCWRVVKGFYKAWNEFVEQARQALTQLEEQTGRQYGNPERPLLLSIRSGAAVSMPGMMATIHNVGLNEEIVEEFARTSGQEYLAWDNYRRFLQSWGMTKGLDRDVFSNLMNAAKARHGVSVKRQFTPAQMKELALDYQHTVRSVGIGIPEDPWLQLTGALELVLDSWNATKTRDYRSLMDMSDAWGTAVIIQAMVFGNQDENAGSGVVFTAHPYRKVRRVALWGDYAPGDQGEDIVGGLVATYPISVEQAELDGRSEENSLERRFPEIYKELLALARELVYEKGWNPQEMEFTFESPRGEDFYILQTRDMITIKKAESFNVFAESVGPEAVLGKGIGVSGSALAGKAVFTEENIRQLRREEPDTPLILIRQDTVPEDIKAISMADGLLTARGGQTSHASVVTIRLEKTCVVGCNALKVYESDERCEIDDQVIRFGDPVSIDGRKGLFLKGMHQVRKEVHILPI